MSSEWQTVEIGSLCLGIYDGPHATPKKTSNGPVFLGISSLNNGQLDLTSFEYLSEEDFEKWTRRVVPQAGDIVFSYETRLGQVAVIPDGLRCCLGRRMALMRVNPEKAIPDYLLYAYLSPGFQDVIRQRTIHGSTVDRIPLVEFRSFPISVPPLDIQKNVVATLRALDDRIVLLREANTTLEAVAQTLYKSWFVDFDPVRAKMEGRTPEDMDEAIACLFPDNLEEAELGLLPSGWNFAAIRDMVEGVYDGPHATPPEADCGPVFLGIKNLTGTALDLSEIRHIAEAQWEQWTRRVEPQAGDIVFSYEATLGYFALIPPGLRCCLGRRLALIRPKARDGATHFWFHQFTAAPFKRLLEKHTIQGATVNRIALKEFPSYNVLNPPLMLQLAFDKLVAPLWAKIHENQTQAQTLTELRDTLLPRLISGQLRINVLAD
jgi:type I restriction enzyme S subunit